MFTVLIQNSKPKFNRYIPFNSFRCSSFPAELGVVHDSWEETNKEYQAQHKGEY